MPISSSSRDGKIHTPIADCFLDGITRQTVIGLARKRGLEVIERRIMPDELTDFSECFITGSAAEVTAVAEIAHWNFNPGGITRTLMDDYTAEVNPKRRPLEFIFLRQPRVAPADAPA